MPLSRTKTVQRLTCAVGILVVACFSGPSPHASMRFPSFSAFAAQPTTPESSPVFAHAAVAADHTLASQAGLEVLRAGGNAVDVAVATSFALSVVRPYSCGIGGGGFMLIFLKHHPRLEELTKGKAPVVTTCVNYRETAAAHATPDFFEHDPDPDAATHGGKAVAIPGHVAGMLHALETYGTMSREQVLAPAIRLAESGFAADAHFVSSSQEVIEWIKAKPGRTERFEFLWKRLLKEGAIAIGDPIDLKEQAVLLREIASKGRDAFYTGPVADAIVRAVTADGGTMTREDLRTYRVEERSPLLTTFRGDTVLSMPPPSSGGIVLAQVLGMISTREADFDRIVRENGHNSSEYIHFVAETFKHAFADRARWMGDPNFVNVPSASLTSDEYLADRAESIDLTKTQAPETYGTSEALPEDHGTSHLCVVDAWGNAVACSETINLVFGSLVAVPEYGFILNDTMDDFLTRDGKPNAFGLAHAALNKPVPGKRPLSSMTPTIVLREPHNPDQPTLTRTPTKRGAISGDAGVSLIAGGSGGPRIISGTIQATLNVLVFDLAASEALSRPRFHHQWDPHMLQLEKGLRGTTTEEALRTKYGHETGPRDPVAAVQIIRSVPGGWSAASDPRKGGAPAGY